MFKKQLAIFYAGTNGSGKSSLREINNQNMKHIDSDAIAKQLNPNNVRSVDLQAGREAICQFNEVINKKTPFSMETTLTGKSSLNRIKEAKSAGFEVELHYVGLDHVEKNIERVAFRVANGGHYIDEHVIRKRYNESLENLQQAILIADKVIIFDNSGDSHSMEMIFENKKSIRLNQITPNWILQVEENFRNSNLN